MAFLPAQQLPKCRGQCAQGHALVDFHVIADSVVSPITTPGAVIDKKSTAQLRAGMDIDPGQAVRVFGHDARQQRTCSM